MKKYYGYFVYDGEPYIIRFKIDGSLHWDNCVFIDKDSNWLSSLSVISMAALSTPDFYETRIRMIPGSIISHRDFNRLYAKGIKEWIPRTKIIKWD